MYLIEFLFNHFSPGINHHPLRSKSVWKLLSTSTSWARWLVRILPPKKWVINILLLRAWYISTNILDIIVIFECTMYVLRSTDQNRKFIAHTHTQRERERERERERDRRGKSHMYWMSFAKTNTWSIMWHICRIF